VSAASDRRAALARSPEDADHETLVATARAALATGVVRGRQQVRARRLPGDAATDRATSTALA
jgi:hypothetical protein